MAYSEYEIERVLRAALRLTQAPQARSRSVDKANVLGDIPLWRAMPTSCRRVHPTVERTDMLVDNCAMQLVANPAQFDVIVTENTFGDILSDEASELTGRLACSPRPRWARGRRSSSPPWLGARHRRQGHREPARPDALGLADARLRFGMTDAADAVEAAVEDVLDDGWRTVDIADETTPAENVLGTSAMADKVIERLRV
jgi:3-isopropylmalate dehydrogenase